MEEPSLVKMTLGSPEFQVTTRLLFMERERAANGRVSHKHRGNVRQALRNKTSQQNRNCDTSCAQAGVQRLCARRWHVGAFSIYTKSKTTSHAREAKPNSSTKRGAHLQPRPQDVFNRLLKPESQETRESVHSTLPRQWKWHVCKRLARLDVPSTEEGRSKNYQKLRRLSAARRHGCSLWRTTTQSLAHKPGTTCPVQCEPACPVPTGTTWLWRSRPHAFTKRHNLCVALHERAELGRQQQLHEFWGLRLNNRVVERRSLRVRSKTFMVDRTLQAVHAEGPKLVAKAAKWTRASDQR